MAQKILFRLTGDVNELAIGGQEFWIDDLCIIGSEVIEPVAGCTNPQACNYNPEANEDDDSCYFAEAGYDCEGNCLFDEDEDGVCDQWEIVGCQDESACNYDSDATQAGYCDYPEAATIAMAHARLMRTTMAFAIKMSCQAAPIRTP